MAFDAFFTAAVTDELSRRLTGARVEKIYMPSRDLTLIVFRTGRTGDNPRLLIDVGASMPRVQLTSSEHENPAVPPMFCMLLRKHLGGATLSAVEQQGFERAVEFTFETRDELGYPTRKYLVAEIMGKCSNLILLSQERTILGAVKQVDFSVSSRRQVLPGMEYEAPPSQADKRDPFELEPGGFAGYLSANPDLPPAKAAVGFLRGVSPLVSREIAHVGFGDPQLMQDFLDSLLRRVSEKRFEPTLLLGVDGVPVEYCFMPVSQYGNGATCVAMSGFGELLDRYYGEKSRACGIAQRSADIHRVLTNAESRLEKKIALQRADLAECIKKDDYRRLAELITSNIYRLKKGDARVELIDYSSEDPETTVTVELDPRLTPSANAAKLFKRYNKLKTAERMLTEQLELAQSELDYIRTVFDSLSRAENEADLTEIRSELAAGGYVSSARKTRDRVKSAAPKPMTFTTGGGYRVLCGKNNIQNEHITHRVAGASDIWFHAKGVPGSHTVMLCGGAEPPASDYTECAVIAAVHSKAPRGQKVAVDYTRIKNIRKPSGSRPGFVTYVGFSTAYVEADEALAASLRSDTKGH